MHCVERDADDDSGAPTYGFVICNSGDGAQYHPPSTKDFPKRKHRTAVRVGHIPRERIVDPNVWYFFWRLQATREAFNSPEMFYEVFVPHMAGPGVTAAAAFAQSTKEGRNGEFETAQRAGTCYFRCILSCLKYTLKADGLDRAQRKQFFHALRVGWLVHVERALVAPPCDFTDSDARLVEMGCMQTALSSTKARPSRGHDEAAIAALIEVRALVERVRAAAAAAPRFAEELRVDGEAEDDLVASAAGAAGRSQLAIPESGVSVPYAGWDLVADARDTQRFRGGATTASPDMYVHLLASPTPLWRAAKRAADAPTAAPLPPTAFVAVMAHIERVAERCNRLRSKSAMAALSLSLHQICAMVEHTFATYLPLPLPRGGAAAKSGACAYSVAGVGVRRSAQRRCLRQLSEIGAHYAAAALTLPSDVALDAHRALTVAAITVVFDAVVRVVAEDGALPTTALLNGTARDPSIDPDDDDDDDSAPVQIADPDVKHVRSMDEWRALFAASGAAADGDGAGAVAAPDSWLVALFVIDGHPGCVDMRKHFARFSSAYPGATFVEIALNKKYDNVVPLMRGAQIRSAPCALIGKVAPAFAEKVAWEAKTGSGGRQRAQFSSPKTLVGALGEIVGPAAFDLESEGTAFEKVHGLCYSAFGGASLAERSASWIVTDPQMASARDALLAYIEASDASSTETLFELTFARQDKAISLAQAADTTLIFTQGLLDLCGRGATGDMPPQGEGSTRGRHGGGHSSDIERRARWMISTAGWADTTPKEEQDQNKAAEGTAVAAAAAATAASVGGRAAGAGAGPSAAAVQRNGVAMAPEFPQLRNLMFIYRLFLTPLPLLIKANAHFPAVWLPAQVAPLWDFLSQDQDGTMCNMMTQVRCSFLLFASCLFFCLLIYSFLCNMMTQFVSRRHGLNLDLGTLQSATELSRYNIADESGGAVGEDDVLFSEQLPWTGGASAGGGSGARGGGGAEEAHYAALSSENAELLLSYLTVPYLALPLVLEFFRGDNVGALMHRDLQDVLDSVLFSPRAWASRESRIDVVPVPEAKRAAQLATRPGLLLYEVVNAPRALLAPLKELCAAALRVCVGNYKCSEVALLLYVARTVARVLAHFEHARVDAALRARYARAMAQSPESAALLRELQRWLSSDAAGGESASAGPSALAVLLRWLEQAEAASDTPRVAEIHAHLVVMRSAGMELHGDVDARTVRNLLCSAAYVVSWHSKAPSRKPVSDAASR
jgi:hypothetical protein